MYFRYDLELDPEELAPEEITAEEFQARMEAFTPGRVEHPPAIEASEEGAAEIDAKINALGYAASEPDGEE